MTTMCPLLGPCCQFTLIVIDCSNLVAIYLHNASYISVTTMPGSLRLCPVTDQRSREQQCHAKHTNKYVLRPISSEIELTRLGLLALVPDVVQTLSKAQNITILAPSNAAFVNLMARNPRSAELMRNPKALAGVLQYHVLVGRLLSGDFSPTPKFPSTLLTAPFANVTNGQKAGLVMVNGTAKVFSGYKQVATVATAVYAAIFFTSGNNY